jgi:hypothetical protein
MLKKKRNKTDKKRQDDRIIKRLNREYSEVYKNGI